MNQTDLQKKIRLNTINTEAQDITEAIREAVEAIGVELGIGECEDLYLKLEKEVNSGTEKLPFTEERVMKAYFDYSQIQEESGPVSAAMVACQLWRNIDREEISIKEFLLTIIALRKIDKEREEIQLYLRNRTNSIQEGGRAPFDADRIKKMIEDNGDQVMIVQPQCFNWLRNHKNSKDCPYELGCAKLTFIMRALAARRRYEGKSLLDNMKTEEWLKEKVEEILSKKTLEELKNVFVPL